MVDSYGHYDLPPYPGGRDNGGLVWSLYSSRYSVACAARVNATAGAGTVYDIGARGEASNSIALVRLIRNVD